MNQLNLTTDSAERLRRHGVSCYRFIVYLKREFIEKNCQRTAAALTYMTLFALVPLLAVFYAMFSLFPAFDGLDQQLQSVIFSHLLPESGANLSNYLTSFSDEARNLSAPGAVLLIVTAYLMLSNIEKSFNVIWGVKHARSGLSSFLLYWAVLSIGPLLLGAGMAASTYLLSLKLVVGEYDIYGLTELFFSTFPWLMTTAAFTLLFVAVPNCKVPFKFGLIGGVISALCFEALKMAFGWIVANSSFSSIYGAFAVVPLFLLWINCLWIIILSGAVLVRTLAERDYIDHAKRRTNFLAVLHILALLLERSYTGTKVTDKECVKTGIGLVHWHKLRSTLSKEGWLAITDQGDYVLSRDLSKTTILDVARLVKMPINQLSGESTPSTEWEVRLAKYRGELSESAKQTLGGSLDALFAEKNSV